MDIWAALVTMRGEVPIGLSSPSQLVAYKSSINGEQLYSKSMAEAIGYMLAEGKSEEEIQGVVFVNDLVTSWTALRSVELSDTPNWYSLTTDTVGDLVGSDVWRYKYSDIIFPYPAFYIELPDDFFFLDTNRGLKKVMCIGVSQCYTGEGVYDSAMLDVGVDGVPPVNLRTFGNGVVVTIYLEPNDEHGSAMVGNCAISAIQLEGEIELSKAFEKYAADENRLPSCVVVDKEFGSFETKGIIFKLVLGLLIRLNNCKQEFVLQRPKSKRRRGSVPTNKMLNTFRLLHANTWVVGSKTKIKPNNAPSSIAQPKVANRAPSELPISVSGHYRRYRCGPRDDWHYELREIKPHVRGGEGPVLGHSYDT